MNIRGIDLNLLVAFDALFDERSVTRAADRLALTQPAVSGMLKRLRHLFADELFVRTSHGIVPTPRAEALAGPVKDLLGSAQALIAPESFDPATAGTTFKLCGSDYMQSAIISPVIAELRRQAPRARVSVFPRQDTGMPDLLARGEIDLLIASSDFAVPDLPARLLCRERFVCIARQGHPLRTGQISLEQLCSFDHLLVAPTGGSFSGPIDDMLAGLGHRRRVAITVPTFPILFDVLGTDDFLAFVPEQLTRNRHLDLKILTVEVEPPPFDIVANWHPRLNGDARHRWLRDFVVEVTKRAMRTADDEA